MRQDTDNCLYEGECIYDYVDHREQWRQAQLGVSDAVMAVLASYGDVTGRASRSEFWWWCAFSAVFLPCVNFLSRMIETEVLWVFVAGLMVIPTLCVTLRRIHDAGYSSWWLLLSLTGVGLPVVLVMLMRNSEPGANRWGEEPNMIRVD